MADVSLSLSCSLLLYASLLQLFSQPKRLILVKCDVVTHQSPFPPSGRQPNWDIVSAAQLYLGSHKPFHTAMLCRFSVKNKIDLVSPACCFIAKSLSFTHRCCNTGGKTGYYRFHGGHISVLTFYSGRITKWIFGIKRCQLVRGAYLNGKVQFVSDKMAVKNIYLFDNFISESKPHNMIYEAFLFRFYHFLS